MSKDEILVFKKFSASASAKEQWQRDSSPWNPDKDPELNMWKKTLVKQISKNLSLTEEIYSAIDEDNKESSIEDYNKRAMIEQAQRPSANLEDLLLPQEGEIIINPTE